MSTGERMAMLNYGHNGKANVRARECLTFVVSSQHPFFPL